MKHLPAMIVLAIWVTRGVPAVKLKGDPHPFLRVSSEVVRQGGLTPGASDEVEHRDVFIAKGGFTNSSLALRGRDTFETILVRGNGTRERLAALNGALVTSRIGTLKDCQILTDPTGIQASSFYRVRWYGKGFRTNHFQSILGPVQVPGMIGCSEEVIRLLQELIRYENGVANHPESEVIASD